MAPVVKEPDAFNGTVPHSFPSMRKSTCPQAELQPTCTDAVGGVPVENEVELRVATTDGAVVPVGTTVKLTTLEAVAAYVELPR